MDVLKPWIDNPIVILSVALLAVVVSGMYITAFFQGRSIAFWPPSIGAKPASDPVLSKGEKTVGAMLPRDDGTGNNTAVIPASSSASITLAEDASAKGKITQGAPNQKLITLGIRLIVEECHVLRTEYQRLQHLDAENTRLPLHVASWPDFNPPTQWTYTQIKLCSLNARMTELQDRIRRVWAEMDWHDRTPILGLDQTTIMAEVLDGLRQQIEILWPKVPDHVKTDSLIGYPRK